MKYIKEHQVEFDTPVFFEPDVDFIDWLIKYANGRTIIDIGAGSLSLSISLYQRGHTNLVAIEPNIDLVTIMKAKKQTGPDFKVLHFRSETLPQLFQNKGSYNPLMIFARPCHGEFVEDTLKLKGDTVEALYITIPENIKLYNDLGIFKNKAKIVNHEGSSSEDEVVLSIK